MANNGSCYNRKNPGSTDLGSVLVSIGALAQPQLEAVLNYLPKHVDLGIYLVECGSCSQSDIDEARELLGRTKAECVDALTTLSMLEANARRVKKAMGESLNRLYLLDSFLLDPDNS